jgi:TctA family transporter
MNLPNLPGRRCRARRSEQSPGSLPPCDDAILDNSTFDLIVMWWAGLICFLLTRLDMPLAPAGLTLVLGPMLEGNFRRGLSRGKPLQETFLSSPVAAGCYAIILGVFVVKTVTAPRRAVKSRAGDPHEEPAVIGESG